MQADTWQEIAVAALTLDDRLRSTGPTLSDSELQAWGNMLAQGERAVFADRLNLDDLTPEALLAHPCAKVPDDQLAWMSSFPQVMSELESVPLPRLEAAALKTDEGVKICFEPHLLVARRSLRQRLGSLSETLLPQVLDSFSLSLARDLALMTESVFELEYLDWGALYREYPALARLTLLSIRQWLDHTAEIIERCAADQEDLTAVFHAGKPLGRLSDVAQGLSDRHGGGRTVAILMFESGRRVVYKPRPMGIDLAYGAFIDWFNSREPSLTMRTPRAISRAAYGYSEWIAAEECSDFEAARRYYQRAGQLLAILHVLRASDCHFENMIAAGEHLQLADLETLLTPELGSPPSGSMAFSSSGALVEQLPRSVLRTLFLPDWYMNPSGGTVEIGGLTGGVEERFQGTEPLAFKTAASINLPKLDGKPLDAAKFTRELLTGFDEAYGLLLRAKEELLLENGPLRVFANLEARFLFQATRRYLKVLEQSLRPDFLRASLRRSFLFDAMAFRRFQQHAEPALWPIVKSERMALDSFDVPLFVFNTTSCGLWDGKGMAIEGFFKTSGLDAARNVISSLSEDDRRFQRQLIELRICLKGQREPIPVDVTPRRIPRRLVRGSEPFEPLRLAREVADALEERAIALSDGSYQWLTIGSMPDVVPGGLKPLDLSLYQGLGGVAAFFAGLYQVSGDERHADHAYRTIQQVRERLQVDPHGLVSEHGLDVASGLGGALYAMALLSRLLDDPSLLEEALSASRILSPAAVRTLVLDPAATPRRQRKPMFPAIFPQVLTGVSGLMLALLSLHRLSNDPEVLALATLGGEQLLRSRDVSESGFRAWETYDDRMLTGFSHGAAGIGYALLKLAAATGDAPYREAAFEAFDYENAQFDENVGNWKDKRLDPKRDAHRGKSWCFGAPGILLSRLEALKHPGGERFERDIERGIALTLEVGPRSHSSLCCGGFGRVDILLEASERLQRPALREQALGWIQEASERHEATDAGVLSAYLCPSPFEPGFFQGSAGIGYTLLRATDPACLPSVLALS